MNSVDFVIVAFSNRRAELESLSADLLEGARIGSFEGHVTIVVNDGMLSWDQDGVSWIELGQNCGFARATTIGARAGSSDMIVFANPDCRVNPEELAYFLKFLSSHSGVLVPLLTHDDGRVGYEQYSNWCFTLERLLSTKMCRRYLRNRRVGSLPRFAKAPGAFLGITRDCVELLNGPFDDAFFLYGEDRDLTRRARSMGINVNVNTDVRVFHSLGGSADGFNEFIEYCRTDAALRIAFRSWSRLGVLFYLLDQTIRDRVKMVQGRKSAYGVPAHSAAMLRWIRVGLSDPGRIEVDTYR